MGGEGSCGGSRPRVVAVVGPTAAGKTALGLALAHALGGEVVNADAMQCYRGMDIGTAKLPAHEWEGIPHHLLDIWAVRERASVADYQRRGIAVVDELLARGVTPIVVGGSGLYLRALLDDLALPPTDPAVRAELEEELEAVGPAALHRRLALTDPVAAKAMLPSNGRRIVRALEVVALTGSFSATMPDGRYRWPTVQLGVSRADLAERIEDRVAHMFRAGLVEEVTALREDGLAGAPTARKALGYAQVLAMPDDPVAAAEATVRATRRYARRQRSWFRGDPRIVPVATAREALAAVT
jgi:tRNA dimethylallyltransferase